MKKVLTLLLAALLVFSLAGCSASDYKKANAAYEAGDYETARAMYQQLGDYKDSAKLLSAATDKLIEEALVGDWISGQLDGTELFLAGLTAGITEEDEDFMKFFEIPQFNLQYCLKFTKAGTIVESIDPEVFNKTMETLKINLKKAFVAYMEEALTQEAAAYGMSYKDLMKAYNAKTTEDLITVALGFSTDDFVDGLMDSVSEAIVGSVENGTYSVKDGVISLNVGTNTEKAIFDLEKMELTLTGEGVSAEEKSMYPIVLTQNNGASI